MARPSPRRRLVSETSYHVYPPLPIGMAFWAAGATMAERHEGVSTA
jgi:hypothetical protein